MLEGVVCWRMHYVSGCGVYVGERDELLFENRSLRFVERCEEEVVIIN